MIYLVIFVYENMSGLCLSKTIKSHNILVAFDNELALIGFSYSTETQLQSALYCSG